MPSAAHPLPRTSGTLRPLAEHVWEVSAAEDATTLTVHLPQGDAVVLDGTADLVVLPSDADHGVLAGRGTCWVLPEDSDGPGPAWLLTADGPLVATRHTGGWDVEIHATRARLTRHRPRPHADVHGDAFVLDLPGGDRLADALAGFLWGTMLPSVIERTAAADYPDAAGYVVSTLAGRYAGTYPDVDHEFQVKGRLAAGSRTDLHVVRRMIELQLRMMREDPEGLWRDPCAVQPDGTREYHVRRSSQDGSANAVMFLVTGNVEVVEEVWLYVARTGDLDWLRAHLADLEGALSCVEDCLDRHGRLWGDVYYEDQVIKDGRETMAAALAARSFALMAELEDLLGHGDRATGYRAQRARVLRALAAPLPLGHWDPEHRRFVDWVDRSGRVHDHLHLLANVLPVLVGATDAAQTADVLALVDREIAEFQRFPTFLSARVADYTPDEIGDGGPYDLCAAGRYWCWDAAFWSWRGDGGMLAQQLDRVARQAASEGYVMGERYDMGHVYYVDGTDWHGAAHYYEYPCVFTWVLHHELLGLRPALDADLLIDPRLTADGAVTLDQHAYRLAYRREAEVFTLTNRAAMPRTFRFDLRGTYPGSVGADLSVDGGAPRSLRAEDVVTVPAGSTVTLRPRDASAAR